MTTSQLISKLNGEKWMLSSKDFYSFYKSVEKYQDLRVGGLYSKVFGNPKMASTSQTITIPSSDNSVSDGDIAIVIINGILVKGAGEELQEDLNLCNTDDIVSALKSAAANPSIKFIILWFNSPGGQTQGIEELGRLIKNIDSEVKYMKAFI